MSEVPPAQSTDGNANSANGSSALTGNQPTLNNTTGETAQLQPQPQTQTQPLVQALSQAPQQHPQQQPPQQPQQQQPLHTGYPATQSSAALVQPQPQPHQQNPIQQNLIPQNQNQNQNQNHNPYQPRSLNVKDALSYLDQVKLQFQHQPDVYNRFLDIMKEFKSQSIDTPGVIERVSTLFRGHPTLVTGFNTFLPPGYRIEATMNPLDPIRVYTPTGLQTSSIRQQSPSVPAPAAIQQQPQHYINQQPPQSYYSHPQHQPQNLPLPQQQSHISGPPPQSGSGYHIPSQQHQQSQQQNPPPYSLMAPSHGLHTQPVPQQLPQPIQAAQQPPILHQVPLTQQIPPMPPHLEVAQKKTPVEFGHAISYVNKIKNRFSNEPDTYKHFLEILQTYQKESKPIQEVYAQVQVLFKGAPDLLDEFKHFLPEVGSVVNKSGSSSGARTSTVMPQMATWSDNRRPSTSNIQPPSLHQLPVKKAAKRTGVFQSAPVVTGSPASFPSQQQPQQQLPSIQGSASLSLAPVQQQTAQQQLPPKKQKLNKGAGIMPGGYIPGGPVASGPGGSVTQFPGDANTQGGSSSAPSGNIEELEWIDKCKRSIGNRTTYNEFLKVLNLFSNEIIDAKTLVERVEPFLAKSPELFTWFKKFVKYEEEQVVYNFPAARPDVDFKTCRKSGRSYRLLPDNFPRSVCSGRDDLCREILNDDWISQPEYLSETGFTSHRKNIYEEALHKCEEERYEFDINIEANLHTIALLEPIYRRIQAMSPDERSKFKLPVGLGGTSKTLYRMVVRKIYGNEKGLDVIDALHNNPSVAVPVVLKRLKQKDEEWKRCQRDWNKVWREVDLKNYHKALDHQGINFKTTDRKALTPKTLITEIENLYREQRERKRLSMSLSGQHQYGFQSTNPGGPLTATPFTRQQMDFTFPEPRIFSDARRLIMMQVGTTGGISQSDEDRIEEFLRNFSKKFFASEESNTISGVEQTAAFVPVSADDEGDEDEEMSNSSVGGEGDEGSTTGTGSNLNTKPSQTLRREVLMRQAAAAVSSSSSPVLLNADKDVGGTGIDVDAMSDTESASGKITSTHIRPALRGLHILCSRLLRMKQLSDEFQRSPPHHLSLLNPVAVGLGLQNPDSVQPISKDRYTEFIRAVHDLFASKIESVEFEDRVRGLFGAAAFSSYTIDKLVQQIVKQIQTIVQDPVSMDLVELYFRDRDKPVSSARQESVYRLNAERLCEDDNMYRLEYHIAPRVLTFQLLTKEDPVILDGTSVEERWSIYVDQFIQLSSSSEQTGIELPPRGVLIRRSQQQDREENIENMFGSGEPFLRRNVSQLNESGNIVVMNGGNGGNNTSVSNDTVEMRSGLELKICLNTYKMFFVEDTEDYFARRRRLGRVAISGAGGEQLRKRRNGWDPAERIKANEKRLIRFRNWFDTRVEGIKKDEAEWVIVDKNMAADGNVNSAATTSVSGNDQESGENAFDNDVEMQT
ncbi:Transcriptional regulatory protein sin3 [Physocladia obscura]|uniref:Transcriptional regulatory protein sin3 n=1 Tax=Physocladia obscura TaxID=109957 RepID=A0AAD5XKV5_9FUNG|nr:Transcriptional regulatory protein sin3 [Physocladia obscura]